MRRHRLLSVAVSWLLGIGAAGCSPTETTPKPLVTKLEPTGSGAELHSGRSPSSKQVPRTAPGGKTETPLVNAEEQQKAIALINQRGGKFNTDRKNPAKPVIKIKLDFTDATDADLAQFKGLTQLRSLSLMSTLVTDAGMKHLKGLTSLQDLNLKSTAVTDKGLQELKGLTNLQTLTVTGSKVTDDGVNSLKQALPKLEINR